MASSNPLHPEESPTLAYILRVQSRSALVSHRHRHRPPPRCPLPLRPPTFLSWRRTSPCLTLTLTPHNSLPSLKWLPPSTPHPAFFALYRRPLSHPRGPPSLPKPSRSALPPSSFTTTAWDSSTRFVNLGFCFSHPVRVKKALEEMRGPGSEALAAVQVRRVAQQARCPEGEVGRPVRVEYIAIAFRKCGLMLAKIKEGRAGSTGQWGYSTDKTDNTLCGRHQTEDHRGEGLRPISSKCREVTDPIK